jgi:hypothetical protein
MSVQSKRLWFLEQRRLYVMKLRVAMWWSAKHPSPFPSGVLSPEQLLVHLKEHHPNLFENEWVKTPSKLN